MILRKHLKRNQGKNKGQGAEKGREGPDRSSDGSLTTMGTDLCHQEQCLGTNLCTVLSLSMGEGLHRRRHQMAITLSLHGLTDEDLFTGIQSKFILFGHDGLMMIIEPAKATGSMGSPLFGFSFGSN